MISVNDEPAEYEPGLTVATLLARHGFATAMVAVWVHDEFVRRSDYAQAPVPDDADVTIVLMAPGG